MLKPLLFVELSLAMGSAIGILQRKATIAAAPSAAEKDDKEDEDDGRRRNSLAFYISQFVNYDGEDFTPVVEAVMKDKYSKSGGKLPVARPSSKYRGCNCWVFVMK